MKKIISLLAIVALPAALTACDMDKYTESHNVIGPGFGNSTAQNFALQVIDPAPPEMTDPAEMHGERAALMFNRYKKDQATEPEEIDTQSVGGSSSN
jgi:hypothetical protein